MRKLLIALLLALAAAACGQAATPTPQAAAQISLAFDPQTPAPGDATLRIRVSKDGQPLANAPVSVHGDMTHPGMRPVLADATTDANGQASVPFNWSMVGDWFVTVTVTLPDKSQVSQDFNVTVNP